MRQDPLIQQARRLGTTITLRPTKFLIQISFKNQGKINEHNSKRGLDQETDSRGERGAGGAGRETGKQRDKQTKS